MKILLLGDASNYHRSLADGLVAMGHEVTVASNGSRWMDTERDIDVSRRPGKLGGALLWARLRTVLAGRLRGYDVVQINNPVFLDLRPGRVRDVFDRLRRDNGGVFLTALGTDTPYVEMCLGQQALIGREGRPRPGQQPSPRGLRYSEWAVGTEPSAYALSHRATVEAWLAPQLADHSRHIYDNIDGAVSALYEYHLAIQRWLPEDRIAYGGIPVAVDVSGPGRPSSQYKAGTRPGTSNNSAPVNIMLACHRGREVEKGADLMLPVLEALRDDMPGRVHLDFVQDAPFEEFSRLLDRAHIVVDQLYSYTPATTALMAMARGKVTVSGAEPEYYDFIGEHDMHPIINADPIELISANAVRGGDAAPSQSTPRTGLYERLRHVVEHPEELARLSAEGPRFVARHNAPEVVARRFVDFWERRLR